MAKGDTRHSFGQVTLHPENNGALVIVHRGIEGDGEKVQWGGDAHVEFRWKELEEKLGASDAATFMSLLAKVRDLAKAKCADLKTSVPAKR